MVNKLDLHIHTSYSDGKLDLKRDGVSCFNGYNLISITDHENIFNPDTLMVLNCNTDTRFISGVEICCNFKGNYIEILGYDYDVDNDEILSVVTKVRNQREFAISTVLSNNNISDYRIEGNPFRINVCLPEHIDSKAFWSMNNDVYKKIYHSYDAEAVINAILNAGGIPVLAHPMESLRGYDEDRVERIICSLGIKHVELMTPKHTMDEIKMLERIITHYDLSASIGSDSHTAVLSLVPYDYDLRKRYFRWIHRYL